MSETAGSLIPIGEIDISAIDQIAEESMYYLDMLGLGVYADTDVVVGEGANARTTKAGRFMEICGDDARQFLQPFAVAHKREVKTPKYYDDRETLRMTMMDYLGIESDEEN